MKEQLEKINDFIANLDTETLKTLNLISVEKTFKKGDFLLKQGQVCKKSFWIVNGIARKYYLNDGKELTTEFYFENDIAISFYSYSLQKPSNEYIQILTDTTISQTDFEAFQFAKNNTQN